MSSDFGAWLRHGLHATEAERGIECIVETLAIECTMKYLGIVKGLFTQTNKMSSWVSSRDFRHTSHGHGR